MTARVLQAFMIYFLFAVIAKGKNYSQDRPDHERKIRIGLLIQDSSCLSAVRGAETAVRLANRNEGPDGIAFSVVVRSMEGPWGTGSKQAVSLVFDEKVTAILGSHDGRNAHLVEQVSAKTRIPFISAWSGDPTLAQAFIPWYYSCVPNYNQQADALIDEIYTKRKLRTVTIVSGSDYDSKLAARSFLKEADLGKVREPALLTIADGNIVYRELTGQIIKTSPECVVIFAEPETACNIISVLRSAKPDLPIFISLLALDENKVSIADFKKFGNIMLAIPAEDEGSLSAIFRKEFLAAYGRLPGSVASYTFDSMNLLIEAIRSAGNDLEKFRKFMSAAVLKGVTGTIRFDSKGNRTGKYFVTELQNLPDY